MSIYPVTTTETQKVKKRERGGGFPALLNSRLTFFKIIFITFTNRFLFSFLCLGGSMQKPVEDEHLLLSAVFM